MGPMLNRMFGMFRRGADAAKDAGKQVGSIVPTAPVQFEYDFMRQAHKSAEAAETAKKPFIIDRLGTIDNLGNRVESSILHNLGKNAGDKAIQRMGNFAKQTGIPVSDLPQGVQQQVISGFRDQIDAANMRTAARAGNAVRFAGGTLTNPMVVVPGAAAGILGGGHLMEQRALQAAIAQEPGMTPEEAELAANTLMYG